MEAAALPLLINISMTILLARLRSYTITATLTDDDAVPLLPRRA